MAGSGNVYVANTYNNDVVENDQADAPGLTFATTAPGSTSSDSPQVVTLLNAGNGVLTFSIPGSGSNPSISSGFTLGAGESSACPVISAGASAVGTLSAGQSCEFVVSFAPTQAGTFSGGLVLSDNALNEAASQSVGLSGVGTGSTQQTITFGAIPAQQANTTAALAATASSGLQVTFTSATTGVCTVAGSVASLVTAGTCTLVASQAGSPAYAAGLRQ